ncbi:MAG: hypothetical protein ACRETN_09755 [Nevskiales bacterium]
MSTRCLLLVSLMLLTACAAQSGGRGFRVENLAKSDIDFVVDSHIRAQESHLRELTIKLYRRNPAELKKKAGATLDSRLAQLFARPGELILDELQGKQTIEAMLLGFEENYSGDRVFAIMAGLTDMLRRSCNYKQEFFLLDELDQQKLYNSARNIEVLVWRIGHRRDPQGKVYLLTNEIGDDASNLSFERLFGKMIALQDMLAQITADTTNRSITKVLHNAATMVFLPI